MKIICDFSVFYLDETLPKGSIGVECGEALLKHGYKLKFFNTINFSKSMRYNPMAYIHSEKDVLKLVTALMTNTKGEGQGGDPFWDKAERLLLVSLIAYLHYEAPVEEQNFATLLEMLNTMLNQANGDRQILAKQLNISPHQLSYVTHSGEGEGLLFFGNVILPFVDYFPKDLELYRILTTRLSEVAEAQKHE